MAAKNCHLSPLFFITSTNRHTHLPLDVGKVKESDWMLERSRNRIGCWKGQGIGLDVGKVKESSGCVYWLRLFKKGGDKWQFLAAIIAHRTAVTPSPSMIIV